MLAHIVIETTQDILAAIDESYLAAEPREHAGELHRDIAATLDDDPLRQRFKMECLVGGDHMLDAGNVVAVIRPAAGCDQDMLGRDPFAGCEFHRPRAVEHRATLDQFDLEALERGRIGRFEAGDFPVLVGDQRRPVEHRLAEGPAVAGRVLELLAKP